ncbi:hypothetical protein QBC47DRAFT_198745 [Echria macrotheca]|uniref:Uncharacterized protein n=1 Tax=Echria macrotheca TaxID=438768 RepID=A0AAJ0BFI3_9PEZI|nr:hypothetical protein QBC47DRAFT_198745 [Echria macrotheca]
MFKTKTLSSFKGMFPPIHQPLPLDKRESKKLLETITSSFRAQLDREHGAPTTRPPLSAPTARHLSAAGANIPERPVDRHLRAILTNPLFGQNNEPTAPRETKSPLLSSSGRNHKEVFEKAVGKGLMTIDRAHGFLLAVLKSIRESSTGSVSLGMRESGAGLLVVQWLRASGQEQGLSFLSNKRFIQLLLRYMVAGDLSGLAWTWFQRLIEMEKAADDARPQALLESLVVAQWETQGLEEAYSSILKADGLVREHDVSPDMLSQAWVTIARRTATDSWGHKMPTADLFESFLGVGRRIPAAHLLEDAHLDLHHPTKPSHDRAVELLSSDGIWREVSRFKSDSSFAKVLKLLSFDTLKHLVRVGEVKLAEEVLVRISALLNSPRLELDLSQREYFEDAMRWFRGEDRALY